MPSTLPPPCAPSTPRPDGPDRLTARSSPGDSSSDGTPPILGHLRSQSGWRLDGLGGPFCCRARLRRPAISLNGESLRVEAVLPASSLPATPSCGCSPGTPAAPSAPYARTSQNWGATISSVGGSGPRRSRWSPGGVAAWPRLVASQPVGYVLHPHPSRLCWGEPLASACSRRRQDPAHRLLNTAHPSFPCRFRACRVAARVARAPACSGWCGVLAERHPLDRRSLGGVLVALLGAPLLTALGRRPFGRSGVPDGGCSCFSGGALAAVVAGRSPDPFSHCMHAVRCAHSCGAEPRWVEPAMYPVLMRASSWRWRLWSSPARLLLRSFASCIGDAGFRPRCPSADVSRRRRTPTTGGGPVLDGLRSAGGPLRGSSCGAVSASPSPGTHARAPIFRRGSRAGPYRSSRATPGTVKRSAFRSRGRTARRRLRRDAGGAAVTRRRRTRLGPVVGLPLCSQSITLDHAGCRAGGRHVRHLRALTPTQPEVYVPTLDPCPR